MLAADRDRAEAIDAVATALAEWIVDLHLERDPSLADRYGASARRLWKSEVRLRLQHLAEAIAVDRPALFVHSAIWSREAFTARRIGDDDLRASLRCTREVLAAELPPAVRGAALSCIDQAMAALDRPAGEPTRSPGHLVHRDARMYLLHLLQRDQEAAAQLVFEAHREGKGIAEIYERILRPALAEIGRMWHVQEATVADEHYCTAATQVIMSQLRALGRERGPASHAADRRRVLATSVGGDLHEVGIRMVADLFELAGWHAEYLGPNMPTEEILAVLVDEDGRPAFDLLAVSANTTLSVRAVADLVRSVREHPAVGSLPVLVGGGPFLLVPDLWEVVGADGFAPDAPGSVAVAERLVASRGR